VYKDQGCFWRFVILLAVAIILLPLAGDGPSTSTSSLSRRTNVATEDPTSKIASEWVFSGNPTRSLGPSASGLDFLPLIAIFGGIHALPLNINPLRLPFCKRRDLAWHFRNKSKSANGLGGVLNEHSYNFIDRHAEQFATSTRSVGVVLYRNVGAVGFLHYCRDSGIVLD
jgi:hypothetical protein